MYNELLQLLQELVEILREVDESADARKAAAAEKKDVIKAKAEAIRDNALKGLAPSTSTGKNDLTMLTVKLSLYMYINFNLTQED